MVVGVGFAQLSFSCPTQLLCWGCVEFCFCWGCDNRKTRVRSEVLSLGKILDFGSTKIKYRIINSLLKFLLCKMQIIILNPLSLIFYPFSVSFLLVCGLWGSCILIPSLLLYLKHIFTICTWLGFGLEYAEQWIWKHPDL